MRVVERVGQAGISQQFRWQIAEGFGDGGRSDDGEEGAQNLGSTL